MTRDYSNAVKHLLCFAGFWWLLTEGIFSSWVVGIFVVPIAAWLSVTLFSSTAETRPRTSISIIRLGAFIPFFLLQSLRGGWATACLAIRPSMPVDPAFMRYSIALPNGLPRLFFLHVVSLLPGTVSASLQGNCLLIHALDASSQEEADLRACEQRVAKLFNVRDADSVEMR